MNQEKRKILVIEDEEHIAEGLKLNLSLQGYQVKVARDGIEVKNVGVVPFETVLSLHRTSPSLFQTGGVTVVVPGLGEVPATWCDGL